MKNRILQHGIQKNENFYATFLGNVFLVVFRSRKYFEQKNLNLKYHFLQNSTEYLLLKHSLCDIFIPPVLISVDDQMCPSL